MLDSIGVMWAKIPEVLYNTGTNHDGTVATEYDYKLFIPGSAFPDLPLGAFVKMIIL